MANIGLSINQISTVLNSLLTQAQLGNSAVVDTGSFISVAQTALSTAPDVMLQSIGQMFSSRSIVSIRPYERKFKNLERSEVEWGNAVRKLNYIDIPMENNQEYLAEDGDTVDMYRVRAPKVLQTNFYGQNTFQQAYTLYDHQLNIAFATPDDFSRFIGGYLQNKADQREQAHEATARATLVNLIAGVIASGSTGSIKVLSLYNAQNGTTLTATDIMKSENLPDFLRFFVATIKIYMKLMSERSQMFQVNVTGKGITRHTPASRARMYLYTPFMEMAKTQVLADVFNEGYITLDNFEEVNFWQSIAERSTINVTAGYMDGTGAFKSSAVKNANVLGVIFDEQAAGYTFIHQGGGSTPYNPAGGYTNVFVNFNDRYFNDFTEKAIVFTLE